jgi:hypothetical protein
MPPRLPQHVAFDQIADLLRAGAVENARALAAHRGQPAEPLLEKQLESTLDRLAWFYGRGTFENLSTAAIFRTAIDSEVLLAEDLQGVAAAGARLRAQRLVDAARCGVRLYVGGVKGVERWCGVYVETPGPEFERSLVGTEARFLRWNDGLVVALPQSEIDEMRAAGYRIFVLFLDCDELLDLAGRGERSETNAELARRLAIARTATDCVGDLAQAHLVRRLFKQSVVLRNLRDRLEFEHSLAHRALLPILRSHRTDLEDALAAGGTSPYPLLESIAIERSVRSLAERWATEEGDPAGLQRRFRVVADAPTLAHLLELESLRRQ